MRRRSSSAMIAALLLAYACTPPAGVTPAQPGPGPTPSPSGVPSSAASAAPAPPPSDVSSSPSAAPTPVPSPSALTTQVSGTIYSDLKIIMPNVTVTAADADGHVLATTQSNSAGVFMFPALPQGIAITLTTSLTGYASRSQKFSPIGTTMAVDFNGDLALTDRPEIVDITPALGATNVPLNTPITLSFSTSVDKPSAIAAFALQVDGPSPFSLPVGISLPAGVWPPTETSSVLDSSHFTTTWVTGSKLMLTPNAPYPSTLGGVGPTYRISMAYKGYTFRNLSGKEATQSRYSDTENTGPFNFGHLQAYSQFTVAAAGSSSFKLIGGSSGGNRIRVQFSQPMYANTLVGKIAGGAGGTAAAAAAANDRVTATEAAKNYTVSINGAAPVGFDTLPGGIAYFDDSDPSHQTVLLESSNPIASIGQTVVVNVINGVQDMFGRSIAAGSGDSRIQLTSSG